MSSAIGGFVGGVGGQTYFANKSAKAQARSYNDAYSANQDMVNQATGLMAPYAGVGPEALSPLTGLLLGRQYDPETGQYNNINAAQQQNLFQKSPGYQFRLDEANKAIQNRQSADGNLLSGRGLKELSRYNQGFASNEYGNYISQLSGLAGMGQNATSSQMQTRAGAIPGLTNLMLGGSSYDAMKNQNYSNAFGQLANFSAGQLGQKQGSNGGYGGGSNASMMLNSLPPLS